MVGFLTVRCLRDLGAGFPVMRCCCYGGLCFVFVGVFA